MDYGVFGVIRYIVPLSEAIGAYENDMPELAEKKCRQAIELNEKDWRSYALMGDLYSKDDVASEAVYWWKKYLSRNKKKETCEISGHSFSWRRVASSLAWAMAVVDYNDAISVAQSVLLDYPNDASAMNTISLVYTKKKKYDLAEKWANKLKDVDEYAGLFRLAYLYYTQGRYTEAIYTYIKVLEVNPESHNAMNNLAVCYEKKYKEEEEWDENNYYSNQKKEHYWEAVRLRIIAARMGNELSQDWLKKRSLEW